MSSDVARNLGPYRLDALIGRGGMGTVHRAVDTRTGATVAVKRLISADPGLAERFAREARLLRDLGHPHVVRYLDHGLDEHGDPYLVMEWLEGEDLAARLARGALAIAEGLDLVRAVAGALAFAHARGVVHRDVKPSNVFLVGGAPRDVRLLDFGIARQEKATRAITATQAIIGTVGYMAPEQAGGAGHVDARADVFALGCLLFEVLTGSPAFTGPNLVAVLAKVLIEPAPSACAARPEVPPALDALCQRMMAKDRASRPADGAEVVRALDGVARVPETREHAPASPGHVTGAELHVVSVVLAAPGTLADAVTLTPEQRSAGATALERAVERFGATSYELADGAVLAVIAGDGTVAHDRAARGARCALAIAELRPDLRVVVATGRAETTTAIPVGPVIDRAANLLREAEPEAGVVADSVTASLLDARFDLRANAGEHGHATRLLGFRASHLAPRRVLGRETPCVGREKELRFLESLLEEARDEHALRVVQIVGPPGLGKSRIVSELLGRAREADGRALHLRVDPVASASPLALVRALLAAAAIPFGGDPVALARARLRDGDAPLVPFLVGLARADAESDEPEFVAARGDAMVAAEQNARALGAWLAAEAASSPPLLLAVEDLQWADAPSVTLLADALRRHPDIPVLLAVALRDEGARRLAHLGPAGTMHDLRLAPLSRRAAELLVRSLLGESPPELIGRLVAGAQGNPLHLEELVRLAAAGAASQGPEPVLAIAEGRLAGLTALERQVLRAASVLGDSFTRDAVAAITGPLAESTEEVLDRLVAEELVVAAPGSRTLSFAHGLLREAAYGALPDADRRRGHLAAGLFLEASGFDGPLVLAEHFARGGDDVRAARHGVAAAEVALAAGDSDTALEIADRFRDERASPDDAIRLRALRTFVSGLHSRFDRAMPLAEALLPEVEPGSAAWWSAAGILLYAASNHPSPQLGRVMAHLFDFSRPLAQDEPNGALGSTLFAAQCGVIIMGETDATAGLIARAEAFAASRPVRHLSFDGFLHMAKAFQAMSHLHSPGALRREAAMATELFERAGQLLGMGSADGYLAIGTLLGGEPERASTLITRGLERARAAGSVLNVGYGKCHQACVHLIAERYAEALADEAELLAHGDTGVALLARAYAATAHAGLGHDERARELLGPVLASPVALAKALAYAVLARMALRAGEAEEAERLARLGLETETRYSTLFEHAMLTLAREDALRTLGREEEARAQLALGHAELLRRAGTFEDAPSRAGFLGLPRHAEIVERARAAGLSGDHSRTSAPR